MVFKGPGHMIGGSSPGRCLQPVRGGQQSTHIQRQNPLADQSGMKGRAGIHPTGGHAYQIEGGNGYGDDRR